MKIRQLLKLLLKNPLVRQFRALWKKFTADWRIHLEEPILVEELAKSREVASIPSLSFFFLLICASVIATLGLIANSTAVIIGAMIIAPLMNPILSMAFGIVTANRTLYQRSAMTVFFGAGSTILISFLISAMLPVDVVGSEITARISPNFLDLGIAIAAGAAGSFSLTRQSIASSIAGVAIAVALVPPLCVAGIGLEIGSDMVEQVSTTTLSHNRAFAGAFLLFIVNFAGITLTACLVFLSQSYGNFNKAFQSLLIWLLVVALLCGPLTHSMKEFFVAKRIREDIHLIRNEYPEIRKQSQIRHIGVQLEGNTAQILILINAPKGVITDEYIEFGQQQISESLSKMGVQAVDLLIRVIPVEIKEYQWLFETSD